MLVYFEVHGVAYGRCNPHSCIVLKGTLNVNYETKNMKKQGIKFLGKMYHDCKTFFLPRDGLCNPGVIVMADDTEWLKLPTDDKCVHKVSFGNVRG